MSGKTSTWYRVDPVYITCSSCGDKGYYPIPSEWWWKHTGVWHSLRWLPAALWRKLRLRKRKSTDANNNYGDTQ